MVYRKVINQCIQIGLGAFLSYGPLSAQTDSLFLTVGQLFELGMENSLPIQADKIRERQAKEQSQTARRAQLPDIEIGLNGGYVGQPILFERGLSHPTRPESPDWSQNYALDLTQPIYQGGRIKHSIKQADIERQIALLQTRTDQADIKLGLLQQYMNLFSYYKQHEVLTRNIEESERRLKDIKRLKEEGVITNNDVLRSELQLTTDRLALQETENTLILLSQQLDILLGLDEHLYIIPDTSLLSHPTPTDSYMQYVDEAYANDPAMLLARQQTLLAQNEVELTKADNRPTISLHAGNTLARPVQRTMADMYNNTWNIGLSVAYPLSSFYKNKHRLNAARLNVHLRQNEEEQLKQSSRLTIRTAYLRHQEAIDRVEALKLSVRQAQENYRIVQNRYLSQLAILTDLLDANSVLLDAELQLTTARTQVVYTYYELQHASGKL
ncbi:transporter [Parabacteroides sp. An277]|uniref:TolC family protein n=1 Tax=Parabacteroides sp. An277 TaxID=1965619 RepID=UPI000B3AE66E|nr:TolC family protein [Parabacteroides sp. An277]OUO55688.1 transporter [Parabacteroides sp. An277]